MRRRRSVFLGGLMSLLIAAFAFAPVAAASTANSSPGACNMLHTAAAGDAGMGQSNGFNNMFTLVISSFGAGCTP